MIGGVRMARFFNPVKPSKRTKPGSDGQLHGGTMEAVDQASNAIAEAVGKIGKDNTEKK
jgi:hypothetical protein